MLQTYDGGCHCGRVRFRIDLGQEQEERQSAHAPGEAQADAAFPHRDRMQVLSGADDLSTYTFGTGTARHTFCRHCGIHAFYQPRSDPENYSVNARCLDDYDPTTMQPRRLFDGQEWEQAFARASGAWAAKR